jgi:O-succinylbenzoate synthase
LDEASADLKARRHGKPLWESVGGASRPIPTSVAVGLDEDPVARIVTTGAAGVKLKIRPGNDVARVGDVRALFPDMLIGVDANGSYRWKDRNGLLAMDGLGVEYVEQPFPADDLTSHARLRDEIVAAVALDEPIDSEAAAIRAIEAGACDVLVVKPSRVGIRTARTIHDLALAGGLRIKASGLPDIADASWYLSGSVVGSGTGSCTGYLTPTNSPGIGFDPDPTAFARYVVRESPLGSRIWD